MSAAPVSRFAESLADTGVSCRRTTPGDVPDAVGDLVDPPAVGVPLPWDGISLTETPVATDWDATDLPAAATGVTPAGIGVASYGTVTVRSRPAGDELVSLYVDRHVAVLHAGDIVADMPAALDRIDDETLADAGSQVLATGPSATADMGGLIEGVHGPSAVDVVVVEP